MKIEIEFSDEFSELLHCLVDDNLMDTNVLYKERLSLFLLKCIKNYNDNCFNSDYTDYLFTIKNLSIINVTF